MHNGMRISFPTVTLCASFKILKMFLGFLLKKNCGKMFFFTNSNSKIQKNKYFGFYNPNTLYILYFEVCIGERSNYKIRKVLSFSDYKIQTPIHILVPKNHGKNGFRSDNMNCINTKIKLVCNIESHFTKHSNQLCFSVFMFQIIVTCSRCVLVENPVFMILG